MKFLVAAPADLGGEAVLVDAVEAGLHPRELLGGAADRREARGIGLDDPSELEQTGDQSLVGLSDEDPAQHVGIEQVPFLARRDLRADLRARIDEALGGEDADRLAVCSARDVELAARGDLAL